MRKLLLLILIIILLALIALFGAPWLIGLRLQDNYGSALEKFSTPHATMKLLKFNRGWFSSTATIKVTTHSSLTPAKGNEFIVKQTIHQGPLVIVKSKQTGEKHWTLAKAFITSKYRGDKDTFFYANVLLSLSDQVTGQFFSKNLFITSSIQTTHIKALKGQFKLSADGNTGSFQFTMNHFNCKLTLPDDKNNPLQTLVLNNIAISGQLFKHGQHWYGSRQTSVGNFNLGMKDYPIKLNGLQLHIDTKPVKDTTDMDFKVFLDSITLPNQTIGASDMVLGLDGLNTKAIDELVSLAQQEKKAKSKQAKVKDLLKMMVPLRKMFDSGFSVILSHLKVTTEHGVIEANGNVAIEKSTSPRSMDAALMGSKMKLTISVPESLVVEHLTDVLKARQKATGDQSVTPVEMAERQLAFLKKRGLFTTDDDKGTLKTVITMKDKKIDFNGKSLPTLLAGMPDYKKPAPVTKPSTTPVINNKPESVKPQPAEPRPNTPPESVTKTPINAGQ